MKIFRPSSAGGAVVAALFSVSASATPLPPAIFTYEVFHGFTAQCPGDIKTTLDGICTSGASFASADGGVPGTPGYNPSDGPGTHVGVGASGPRTSSFSTLTYEFRVGGPPVPSSYSGLIAVDILSSGAASFTGRGLSFASLLIRDSGPDTPGLPDNDSHYIVDSHYDCVGSSCRSHGSAWTQTSQLSADHLCLEQGDTYTITISVGTSIWGRSGSGSASVDPKVIIDPPGPTDPPANCYQPKNPLAYQSAIDISSGASTGVPVPEPATLALFGLALAALGLRRSPVRVVRRAD